jgi:hypothetical protein
MFTIRNLRCPNGVVEDQSLRELDVASSSKYSAEEVSASVFRVQIDQVLNCFISEGHNLSVYSRENLKMWRALVIAVMKLSVAQNAGICLTSRGTTLLTYQGLCSMSQTDNFK